MSYQVIKQDDGRLCVWSSVVDDFVLADADGPHVIEFFVAQAEAHARRDAERVVQAVQSGNPEQVYYQLTMTYQEARARRRAPR